MLASKFWVGSSFFVSSPSFVVGQWVSKVSFSFSIILEMIGSCFDFDLFYLIYFYYAESVLLTEADLVLAYLPAVGTPVLFAGLCCGGLF